MANPILVAEDSWLLAELIAGELQNVGVTVAGPAASLEDALRTAIAAPLSGALLDVELRGGPIFSVCEVLEARRIPFAFVTGRNCERLPDRWRSRMSLKKPFSMLDLRKIVCGFVGAVPAVADGSPVPMLKVVEGR